MGKSGRKKNKGRKGKLARPPKRKKVPPAAYPRELSPAEAERVFGNLDEEMEELEAEDAGGGSGSKPGKPLTPDGVDPSMLHSRRYQKFQGHVRALRETLPEGKESFEVADLPDLKWRQWLTRFCIKYENGELPEWQRIALEGIGFNWKRGRRRKPKAKKAAKLRKPPPEPAWVKHVKELEAWIEAHGPDGALLRLGGKPLSWLRRAAKRYAGGSLKEKERAALEELGWDLRDLAATTDWNAWPQGYFAYWKHLGPGDPPEEVERTEQSARNWAYRQRKLREAGELPAWKVRLLDALDFDWTTATRDTVRKSWLEKLDRYLELRARRGEPVPRGVLKEAGLAAWAGRVRQAYAENTMDPKLREIFEARGFDFNPAERQAKRYEARWNRYYARLLEFKERFGHPMVPSSYVDDPKLGVWLARQRERWKLGKLEEEKVRRFEAIGVPHPLNRANRVVRGTHLSVWKKHYEALKELLDREHGGRVPRDAPLPFKMRSWLKRQAGVYEEGRLDPWQLDALRAIGFDPADAPSFPRVVSGLDAKKGAAKAARERAEANWEECFAKLEAFVAEHGHTLVPRSHPDRQLFTFVAKNRARFNAGELAPEKVERLKRLNFAFNAREVPTPAWMECYRRLQAYRAERGHTAVPRQYPPDQALAEFVAQQKQRGRKGMLRAEHIRLLDAVDFPWVNGERPVPKE